MYAYIKREGDGRIARLKLADGEDVWDEIGEAFPVSYFIIDDEMLLPDGDYEWDEGFIPGEDVDLSGWILVGETYDGELSDGAHIHAERRWHIAIVTWPEKGYEQSISITPREFIDLAMGADPIADGWEDGCGRRVCIENAREVE